MRASEKRSLAECALRLRLSEHEYQVVRGHGETFGKAKAMGSRQGDQMLQVANSPLDIASSQALIELEVAGRCRRVATLVSLRRVYTHGKSETAAATSATLVG